MRPVNGAAGRSFRGDRHHTFCEDTFSIASTESNTQHIPPQLSPTLLLRAGQGLRNPQVTLYTVEIIFNLSFIFIFSFFLFSSFSFFFFFFSFSFLFFFFSFFFIILFYFFFFFPFLFFFSFLFSIFSFLFFIFFSYFSLFLIKKRKEYCHGR